MQIQQFKNHFAKNTGYIHFNNSGQALVPDVYFNEVVKWNKKLLTEGSHCSAEMWDEVEKSRAVLANFVKADSANQVAFFQTTASALSHVAQMLPIEKNDEVLTWDQEYPSNFYPWVEACKRKEAKLILVPSENWQTPIEKLIQQINSKTKAIVISWVQYQTGSVTDLQKLAEAVKGKNIWLVADIIQGVGVKPFNFEQMGFDVVCSGSHKWLCSGYGASFAVFKKSRLPELYPIEFGAMSFGTPDTPKSFEALLKPSAHKFEPGSKSALSIIAMSKTLQLFDQVGVEKIYAESMSLAKKLAEKLIQKNYIVFQSESPIINVIGDENFVAKLKELKVSHALRGPGVRLSFHGYNTEQEIDYFTSAL